MSDSPVMLITGTRKGIGKYLAEHYSKLGYMIEGCSRKSPDWNLPNYNHHLVDIADAAQVKEMFLKIQKKHGRLDVSINNAGIASMNHILLTPEETMKNVLNTNVFGTYLICKESAKLMMKKRFGRIINFSTIAVPLRMAGEAIYASSKSAVELFTRVLAHELAEFGITCNVVAPTPIDTDLIRSVPVEKINNIIDRMAVKRHGSFSDVVNVTDFYIDKKSDAITGQVIYLGGLG